MILTTILNLRIKSFWSALMTDYLWKTIKNIFGQWEMSGSSGTTYKVIKRSGSLEAPQMEN